MNQDRRSFLTQLASLVALLSLPAPVRGGEAAREAEPKSNPGRFGDLDENTLFDVCIIGSGFAGAVLGESLAARGVRTLILESGFGADLQPLDPRIQKLEIFRNSGPIDYPIAKTRVRAVGGTSSIWTGRCPRLHPLDFTAMPDGSDGEGWPINYGEIEPYYDKAEKILQVRGGNLSKFNPPRKQSLPLPANRDIGSLKQLLRSVGVTVDDAPTSTGEDGHRPVRVAESYLPRFQASPSASLISGGTVTRLIAGENGRIEGAEARDLDRNSKIVRARVYVVACGGLESPRLLLLSRSRFFPNGIGNSHDWVGRCFMEHRVINSYGRVGSNSFQIYPQVGRSFQFDDEFRRERLGSLSLGFILMTLRPGDLSLRDLGGLWNRITSSVGRLWRPELRISASPEMRPRRENRVTLDHQIKDHFGNPVLSLRLSESTEEQQASKRARQLIEKIYTDLKADEVRELDSTWSHHHMGTCRMGDSPKTSVVDRNLRVHGAQNLFVSGSSVFATSGSGNPTLTLAALSLRLADYVHARLKAGTFSTVAGGTKTAAVSAIGIQK